MESQIIATEIVKRLVEAGHIAYFAGGWVRDYHLGRDRSDIDIATSATPEMVVKLFDKTVPVGIAFGVVIVVERGHQYEVATFRKDLGYSDGRHPLAVAFCDAKEDALRRDFTINGMFYDPLTETFYDYVGGIDDIENKIIRAIGEPKLRFAEDRLRMLRGVRIATALRWKIDPATEKAIADHASDLFPSVTVERIWQEFQRMADSGHMDDAILTMHRVGLLGVIFPALAGLTKHVIRQRVSPYQNFPKGAPLVLYLMELFPSLTLDERLSLIAAFKATRKDARVIEIMAQVQSLVECHHSWTAAPQRIEWARLYANPLTELCLGVIAARLPDDARHAFLEEHIHQKQALRIHIDRIIAAQPLVTSEMLFRAGIPSGALMGTLLKEAERIAVNDDLHDSASVLRKLRSSPNWPRLR